MAVLFQMNHKIVLDFILIYFNVFVTIFSSHYTHSSSKICLQTLISTHPLVKKPIWDKSCESRLQESRGKGLETVLCASVYTISVVVVRSCTM